MTAIDNNIGYAMHELCKDLFPICRSITGDGVRRTLAIIKEKHLPRLKILEIPTGEKCFDWTIPKEWNIRDAYIIDPDGNKIVDFKQCNLHVVGYSVPIDKALTLHELQEHLYSIPQQPTAIPYITSYYNEKWGFCLKEEQRKMLKAGTYRVLIDSELSNGSLTYGEMIIPGKSKKEIFLSTYVCHPSLANNELSGPSVTTFIAKWLNELERNNYSYRIVFLPETIGSVAYLSRNLDVMKENIIAGFNLTCIGDDRAYSYLPSRSENTLADRVALHVLRYLHPEFVKYTYLDRKGDEQNYCSPGVDLPVASLMRSLYGTYPEYHTSLDDLNLVTPSGLLGGYEVLTRCIQCIECNEKLRITTLCMPQLGKRGLYPTLSTRTSPSTVKGRMNLISYCDGQNTLLDVAEKINVPMWDLLHEVDLLKNHGLLEVVE